MRAVTWSCSLLLLGTLCASMSAQEKQRDRAVFREPKHEFLDSIKAEAKRFAGKETPAKKELGVDFSRITAPTTVSEFTRVWHQPPVSQGISGMCWCFSATSFYESEIYRLTKREVKLSELYTVYWEYVEKARRFVQERGVSEFGQGSEANALPRIWKKYGIVPLSAYSGLKPGQKFHDHDAMFAEMEACLKTVKQSNTWNEDEVVSTIKAIMNHYIGEPPLSVMIGSKQMTPREYLDTVVRLNLDDYVEFLSLMQQPYYQRVEYEVPDNWWHSKDYHNLPLAEYMNVLKKAVRSGMSVCIGGDVSEPGYEGHAGIGVVPTFDIPSAYIDENARQFRFSNTTSTDDHGIHLVGYLETKGEDWYLIKDSGAGSRNNAHPGYYFYHEDYVKLKMLGFTVHRSVAEDVLKKFSTEVNN